ncbi:MAG: hypothetical protein ABI972_26280 [Acidobacteriota bacterium]
MELTGFFSNSESAHLAIEILKRSGYNVDSATVVIGAHARARLDRFLEAERRWRIGSSAAGCAAVSVIFAALLLPPAPFSFPWLTLGAFVAACATLGALGGAVIGGNASPNSVLLDIKVSKDHLNEAMHILRMAGGQCVGAAAVPANLTRLPEPASAVNDPQRAVE